MKLFSSETSKVQVLVQSPAKVLVGSGVCEEGAELAVACGRLLLLSLVFGLLLLHQLLLLLQHHHDVSDLRGGDVDVLFVDQLHHLKNTKKNYERIQRQNWKEKLFSAQIFPLT